MEKTIFIGTLRKLYAPVIDLRPITNAGLTVNANVANTSLKDAENALANIEGAYSRPALYAVVMPFATKFGLTAALTAAVAKNGNEPTPSILADVVEGANNPELDTFIDKDSGSAFLSVLRPAPVGDAAKSISDLLQSRGIIGTPTCNARLTPATVGGGQGKIRTMLAQLNITGGISTFAIASVKLVDFDTTNGVNMSGATVRTIANPFANAAETPAETVVDPTAETVVDPTAKVRAQVAAYFAANGATKAPAMRQLILDEGIELPDDVKTTKALTDFVVANADQFELPTV